MLILIFLTFKEIIHGRNIKIIIMCKNETRLLDCNHVLIWFAHHNKYTAIPVIERYKI